MHSYQIKGLKGALRDDAHIYVRQKPNRKFLGIAKVYLKIYQMFDWKKETRWSKKIKNGLGEPPILYDSALTKISATQIKQYLFNKGYFQAEVTFSDTIKKKKAYVVYKSDKKMPYSIRNIQYFIKDSVVQSIYFYKLNQSKLKIGAQYDQENIELERQRITKDLKNYGYFFFNREYIHFKVDTALKTKQLDIKVYIENPNNKNAHQFYKINDIVVNVNSNNISRAALSTDTSKIDSMVFIDKERVIKAKVLHRMIFLHSGVSYSDNDVELSYNRLGDLGIFKFVSIEFAVDSTDSTQLNSYIELIPGKKQATNTEIEGYVASENIGTSANFVYTNRNIFRGGEVFEFRVKAGLETQAFIDANQQNIPVFNSQETNTSASVTFPGFVFFRDKPTYGIYSNPRTRFGVNYITENRPEYARNTFNSSFSYEWKQNQNISHTVFPFSINFVNSNLSTEAEQLLDNLNNPYIKESFDPHITLGIKYSLIFNNQRINIFKDYFYFRFNIEVMGTGLYAASTLLSRPKNDNGLYQFFDLPYYNFTRPEFDFRYFHNIDRKNQLVYRINSGLGFAYWNSVVLPFERQFFTGGSNSVRAFKARSVGPGTYSDITSNELNLDQTGDFKIEGNFEYRFDIFDRFIGSKLKGASFIDFGNVWTISNQSASPEAAFKFSTFYKELAVGTGVGLRMDYSFLLFRFDLGLKLRDPRFDGKDRWVIRNINNSEWILQNDYSFLNFNFGIGYPF